MKRREFIVKGCLSGIALAGSCFLLTVIKKNDGNFHTLLMKCTHKGSELNQKGIELVCPSHGSIFDLEGNVINTPAKQNLKTYPVSVKKSEIIVHLLT